MIQMVTTLIKTVLMNLVATMMRKGFITQERKMLTNSILTKTNMKMRMMNLSDSMRWATRKRKIFMIQNKKDSIANTLQRWKRSMKVIMKKASKINRLKFRGSRGKIRKEKRKQKEQLLQIKIRSRLKKLRHLSQLLTKNRI